MSIRQSYEQAGEEPDLHELLADPVIHAVMRRDGVTLAELCSAIRAAKYRLGSDHDRVVVLPPPAPFRDWRCPDDRIAS